MRVPHPARLAAPLALLALAATACGSGGAEDASTAASGGAVQVKAGDSSCDVSRTALPAGRTVLHITNTGSKVTEVYVYAPGDRIVTEKEDIAPGLDYQLTASIPAGSYEIACKPGQTGRGIRTAITVAGAGPTADPAATKAVADYRAYVQQQADAIVPLVGRFAAAVKAGDVAQAKALYAPSRQPWEAIEPVAESFGDLDPKIDLREADLETGQTWTGWHRLEKALWVKGSTAGMAPVADQLVTDIAALRSRVATAPMTPASIGNGAKELLDEVANGKITGEEEVFSHTDLVDFAANVAGARQAFEVLQPIVQTSDPTLVTSLKKAFADVDAALAPYRRGAGYVSYTTVDAAGRRELTRVVDALSEPLSRLAAAATAQ
jgi:iron uptake system component EfeO